MGPNRPDSESTLARPRRRLGRIVLFLGGGAAGVIAGIALSAAFSSAADAAPVPTPIAPTAVPLGGAAPPVVSIPNLGGSGTGVVPNNPADAVRSAVSSTPAAILATTDSVVTSTHHLADVVGAPLANVPGGSLLAIPGTVVPSSSPGPARRATTPTATIAPFGMALGSPHQARLGAGSPAPPRPAPARPRPSQTPPLTANDSAEYAPQIPQGSPFGSLPPVTLLLPALVLGAVLLTREKAPLLAFDSRHSPPG
jgi:hypothetical protein